MTWFAKILIWIKSSRAAFYSTILLALAVDGVEAWRAFSVYYDVIVSTSKNVPLTATISSIALVAVFLSNSIIAIHRPKKWFLFGLLVFLAVTHDVGAIFFSIFQETLTANSFGDFWLKVWLHPASALLVISLSALGLIPLTLSGVLTEWYNSLEAEIKKQHDDFIVNARREAERLVIGKFFKEIRKKELEDLANIIENTDMKRMIEAVTNITVKPAVIVDTQLIQTLPDPKSEKDVVGNEELVQILQPDEEDVHFVNDEEDEDSFGEEEGEEDESPLVSLSRITNLHLSNLTRLKKKSSTV